MINLFDDPLDKYLIRRILIVDADQDAVNQLTGVFSSLRGESHGVVEDVTVDSLEKARSQIEKYNPYIVIIDPNIASFVDALHFIEHNRNAYQHITWVINTDRRWWKKNDSLIAQHPFGPRIRTYYRIYKGLPEPQAKAQFLATLAKCQNDFVLQLFRETTKDIEEATEASTADESGAMTHEQIRKYIEKAMDPILSLLVRKLGKSDKKNIAFVSMIFNEDQATLYKLVIERVLKDVGFVPIMMADQYVNLISVAILKNIGQCSLFIGDLTGLSPNVMIEVGAALMTQMPVILIANRKTVTDEQIPFMLKNTRVEFYSSEIDLLEKLTRAVSNIDGR